MKLRLLSFALVLVVALVGFALAIAQDQETLMLRSSVQADAPDAISQLAALTGAPITTGNRYLVLTNGDQIFPSMLESIDNATRRINLETYVYAAGAVAERFTAALERAARRGVTVNVVIDLIGAAGMEEEHEKRLITAGATVRTLNTPRWYEIEEVNYRTHRKILVVDGTTGFAGGAGFADQWLGNAENPDHWRDTHVRIEGPIVRLLEAAFYENFLEASDGPVDPVIGPPYAHPDIEEVSLLLRGAPTGGANDLKRLYLLMFAMARRAIDITTPYFVTDESTLWAFEDAVRRGVKIRLLVEGSVTDAMPVKHASRAMFDVLLSLGVEIYEYQPTMMHAKVLVVDGVLSMFGSANFDNRSLELNDELNIVVASRELAARFLEDFAQDLRVSRQLELERWRERPLLDKARERFWSAFGEVF